MTIAKARRRGGGNPLPPWPLGQGILDPNPQAHRGRASLEGPLRSEKAQPHGFPAKAYGWGWGIPGVWQGWAVLVTYLAAFSFCAFRLDGLKKVSAQVGLTAALFALCWLKGERPRWRWGDPT